MAGKDTDFIGPAQRPDRVGFVPLENSGQTQTGEPYRTVDDTVENLDALNSDASLVYAGYPYNPYASFSM